MGFVSKKYTGKKFLAVMKCKIARNLELLLAKIKSSANPGSKVVWLITNKT